MVTVMGESSQSHHVRSTSLPSSSHPLACRFEEEFHKLKACVVPNSSPTQEIMFYRVECLTNFFDIADDLLQMSHLQNSLIHTQPSVRGQEELDASLKLLDICSSSTDSLSLLKENLRDILSSIRTKKDYSVTHGKISAYLKSLQQAKKELEKCSRTMKQIDDRSGIHPLQRKGSDDLSSFFETLTEARHLALSIFQSIFSFMSTSAPKPKSNTNKWFLPSKTMASSDDVSQCHLKGLETTIDRLEDDLQFLFKRLIRSRVSLLNYISI